MDGGTMGPYRLERRLATGGMAEVFVATRVGLHGFQKRIALKRILPQYAAESDFVEMFIDEARLAAQLDHPNIVHVFDFGKDEGTFFIAMELVSGTNVNQLLRAVAAHDEQVPLEVMLNVALEASSALAYAHSLEDEEGRPLGVVHRDVSPANLLLSRNGHVKLSDFGIARAANFERRTQTGELRGKLGYMSPEQVLAKPLDGRSDVFTLATVLAEMLIVEPLFGKGEDLDVLVAIRDGDLSRMHNTKRRIPNDVRELLLRGLSRSREHRPDATSFYRMVREIMERRAISQSPLATARLLTRLELVSPRRGDSLALEPGARPTNFVDLPPPSSRPPPSTQVGEPTLPDARAGHRAYTVEGKDGRVEGLNFSTLAEMWLRGEIGRDTRIATGREFRPASEYPELARYVGSTALSWGNEALLRPTWQGRIEQGRMLPAVHQLIRARETGVLYLLDGDRRKKIYFKEGHTDFIASTNPEELLGAYLVQSGRCLRMEVDMALAMMPQCGGRLANALVSLGILGPAELSRAVRGQSRERFLEAFRWDRGNWCYVRGPMSDEETFDIREDPYEMMPQAAGQVPSDVVRSTLEGMGQRTVCRSPSAEPLSRAYYLPEPWARMFDGSDSLHSVHEWVDLAAERTGTDEEEARKALYFGLSCELLLVA